MEPIALGLEFERRLGSPFDAAGHLSIAACAERDEAEAFPEEALEELYALGFAESYVPSALGGALTSYPDFYVLGRTMARRDLTVAITASTVAWSTLTWLAGTPEQKQACAAFLRAKKAPCLAYSEAAHGSDLASNETVAELDGSVHRLSGEKWPINRATRGDGYYVLAREAGEEGPLAFSLFFADKAALPAGSHAPLPPAKTLGIRGADISGVRFTRCPLPAGSRIGERGAGLEIALKGLFVTRALCASLSTGALDAALRTTLRLVTTRRLYGGAVWELTDVKKRVALAFAGALFCDLFALAATRALHTLPEEFSTWSAATKVLVPRVVDDALRELVPVHGARYFLRAHHDHGLFQRVVRDHSLVPIFDGSTVVNLAALAGQLTRLIAPPKAAPDADLRLAAALRFDAPLPAPALADLSVAARRNSMLAALPALRDALGAEPELAGVADRLLAEQRTLFGEVRAELARAGRAFARSQEAIELADRYLTLHALATVLAAFAHNRERLAPHAADPAWLVWMTRLLLGDRTFARNLVERIAARVPDPVERGLFFGALPFPAT